MQEVVSYKNSVLKVFILMEIALIFVAESGFLV